MSHPPSPVTKRAALLESEGFAEFMAHTERRYGMLSKFRWLPQAHCLGGELAFPRAGAYSNQRSEPGCTMCPCFYESGFTISISITISITSDNILFTFPLLLPT